MYMSGGEVEANENRGRVEGGEEERTRMRNQSLSLVPNPFGEMRKHSNDRWPSIRRNLSQHARLEDN